MTDPTRNGSSSADETSASGGQEAPTPSARRPAPHMTMNPDANRISKVVPINYSHQTAGKSTVPPDDSRLRPPTSFPAPPPEDGTDSGEESPAPPASPGAGWQLLIAALVGALMAFGIHNCGMS